MGKVGEEGESMTKYWEFGRLAVRCPEKVTKLPLVGGCNYLQGPIMYQLMFNGFHEI